MLVSVCCGLPAREAERFANGAPSDELSSSSPPAFSCGRPRRRRRCRCRRLQCVTVSVCNCANVVRFCRYSCDVYHKYKYKQWVHTQDALEGLTWQPSPSIAADSCYWRNLTIVSHCRCHANAHRLYQLWHLGYALGVFLDSFAYSALRAEPVFVLHIIPEVIELLWGKCRSSCTRAILRCLELCRVSCLGFRYVLLYNLTQSYIFRPKHRGFLQKGNRTVRYINWNPILIPMCLSIYNGNSKYTQNKATEFNVKGWCKNTRDGTVAGQMEGNLKSLHELYVAEQVSFYEWNITFGRLQTALDTRDRNAHVARGQGELFQAPANRCLYHNQIWDSQVLNFNK